MNEKRVGVLGGTFDPIHLGHLAAAQDAAHALDLRTVLFVPNNVPPHKVHQHVTDATDRAAMVDLAISDNPLFALSTVELDRPGPSFTLDTLRALQRELGTDTRLYFLAGCDILPQLRAWHEPHALLNEFQVVVLERPTGEPVDWTSVENQFPGIRQQVTVLRIPQLEISSADIRTRVADARPIRYYVPRSVELYIRKRGLYRP